MREGARRSRSWLALAALALACGGSAPAPKIASYEASGNLAPNRSVGCETFQSVTSADNPPALYDAMVECAKRGDYAHAADMFALAGTESYFDALRVVDATARQAHPALLTRSLQSLSPEQTAALQSELKRTLAESTQLPVTCAEVGKLGPPTYFPSYMIQHGMDAFLKQNEEPLHRGLDPALAWRRALVGYLHCPEESLPAPPAATSPSAALGPSIELTETALTINGVEIPPDPRLSDLERALGGEARTVSGDRIYDDSGVTLYLAKRSDMVEVIALSLQVESGKRTEASPSRSFRGSLRVVGREIPTDLDASTLRLILPELRVVAAGPLKSYRVAFPSWVFEGMTVEPSPLVAQIALSPRGAKAPGSSP